MWLLKLSHKMTRQLLLDSPEMFTLRTQAPCYHEAQATHWVTSLERNWTLHEPTAACLCHHTPNMNKSPWKLIPKPWINLTPENSGHSRDKLTAAYSYPNYKFVTKIKDWHKVTIFWGTFYVSMISGTELDTRNESWICDTGVRTRKWVTA